MMREDEIHAAAMNVKALTQVLHAHRRAFDMPAGPSGAQLRFPEVLPVFRGLPQDKVPGIVFIVLIGFHTRSRLNAGKVLLAQLAVLGKAGDREVNRAIAPIGVAFRFQTPDQ
jgi:hypothetical protein